MRFALLVLVLMVPLSVCVAVDSVYSLRTDRGIMGLSYLDYSRGDYKLGNAKLDWNDAWRVQVDYAYLVPLQERVVASTGAYIYYEERESEVSVGSFSYESFGIGFEGGAMLYLLPGAEERSMNVAAYPYAKFGGGIQDASARRLPNNPGRTIQRADIGDFKYELALGLDIRLQLMQTAMVGVGAGAGIWGSSRAEVWVIDSDGIGFQEDIKFNGKDIFFRLTAGFMF